MEYEKIKALMEDMGNSKLTEVDINFPDGTKISMKKQQRPEQIIDNQIKEEITKQEEKQNEVNKEKGTIVKSPMVGTFYEKPAPTDKPYVQIGKKVKQGDILCIIEAMKLMNEIESEFSGTITEILVKDGDAVEYGTPLFKIV